MTQNDRKYPFIDFVWIRKWNDDEIIMLIILNESNSDKSLCGFNRPNSGILFPALSATVKIWVRPFLPLFWDFSPKNQHSTWIKALQHPTSQQILKLVSCCSRYSCFLAWSSSPGKLRKTKSQSNNAHGDQGAWLGYHCQGDSSGKYGKGENELLDSWAEFLIAKRSPLLEQPERINLKYHR